MFNIEINNKYNNIIIYSNYSDGYEYWQEYDDKDNIIHYKDSNGSEYWCEYDDKGNEIYFKNSSGFEFWYEYDDNGNLIEKEKKFMMKKQQVF